MTVIATAVLMGGDMGFLGGIALGVVADSEVSGLPSWLRSTGMVRSDGKLMSSSARGETEDYLARGCPRMVSSNDCAIQSGPSPDEYR